MLMLARSVLIMEFLIIGFALLVAKDLSTTNSLYFGAHCAPSFYLIWPFEI